jgi:glycosyltransferase involved in cell wall biosynthesis
VEQMLITSSSFFNRAGNQSMLESVREYSKYYDVSIVTTAAESNSYYLTTEEAVKLLPVNVNIYRKSSLFKELLKKAISFIPKKKVVVKLDATIDKTLVNQKYSKFTFLSQSYTTSTLTFTALFLLGINKLKKPDVILAYEISGIPAALYLFKILRKVHKNIKLISRLQGTTLFNAIGNEDLLCSSNYSLDHSMYQKLEGFDLNIMTNDGTNGDKVLNYYSISNDKILHITNGIPSSLVDYSASKDRSLELDSDKIIFSSICRLVGWKRVYLSIEVVNKLVNENAFHNVMLNIYGVGTDEELGILCKLIKEYNLNSYVKIHGGVPHEQVPKILDATDFLLSLYCFTNVTNPLLEALFLRCPIITIEDDNLCLILENESLENSLILRSTSENELVEQIVNYIKAVDIYAMKAQRKESYGSLGNIYTWEERIKREKDCLDKIPQPLDNSTVI